MVWNFEVVDFNLLMVLAAPLVLTWLFKWTFKNSLGTEKKKVLSTPPKITATSSVANDFKSLDVRVSRIFVHPIKVWNVLACFAYNP